MQIQDAFQGTSVVGALTCYLVAMIAIGIAVALVTCSMTTFDEGWQERKDDERIQARGKKGPRSRATT